MAEAQRPSVGAWRTYLELASGLGETSRKQVRKLVRDLAGKGNATAGQLRSMTGELLAANAMNREALGRLVRIEVDRALGRVGLATMDEVNELTARVRELERQLREARQSQATPDGTAAAPARRGRPAKKAATSAAKKAATSAAKATAAASSATSPVVKKATRRPATAPVPAAVPATKATRAVKASAGKAAVAKAPAKAARTKGASQ